MLKTTLLLLSFLSCVRKKSCMTLPEIYRVDPVNFPGCPQEGKRFCRGSFHGEHFTTRVYENITLIALNQRSRLQNLATLYPIPRTIVETRASERATAATTTEITATTTDHVYKNYDNAYAQITYRIDCNLEEDNQRGSVAVYFLIPAGVIILLAASAAAFVLAKRRRKSKQAVISEPEPKSASKALKPSESKETRKALPKKKASVPKKPTPATKQMIKQPAKQPVKKARQATTAKQPAKPKEPTPIKKIIQLYDKGSSESESNKESTNSAKIIVAPNLLQKQEKQNSMFGGLVHL
ncbi:unnamed protein product [Cylicocyclus nassatus]|uniref:Uncharacterized protein n=1 Tax=Cylicocyclus nassatus TaxID=53992 RepID=A0AA36HAA4_CYLNA|nr:unnamed protein product [Cylicocyclus nassatus]